MFDKNSEGGNAKNRVTSVFLAILRKNTLMPPTKNPDKFGFVEQNVQLTS